MDEKRWIKNRIKLTKQYVKLLEERERRNKKIRALARELYALDNYLVMNYD